MELGGEERYGTHIRTTHTTTGEKQGRVRVWETHKTQTQEEHT